MAIAAADIQGQVREIVILLMQRPITEAVALRIGALDDFKQLEIVNGAWVGLEGLPEEMTGEEHGRIETNLLLTLGNHIRTNQLGRIYPGDTDFVLDGTPEDIRLKRQADVAFVRADRAQTTSGYFYGAPDLAIEIVSPTQYRPEMLQKTVEYLTHGTQEIWLIFPRDQRIEIHRSDRPIEIYGMGDTISSSDLFSDFVLDVATVFEA